MNRLPASFFLILFALTVGFSQPVRAQYYNLGSDPAGIRWLRISAGSHPLVFPDYFEKEVRKVSGQVPSILEAANSSMKSRLKPFPAVFHPEVNYSNGLAVLAPRRVELFTKHPVAGETGDYMSQLLIHEFRHMVQMDRLDTGFTRFMSYILGEQAQGAILGLHIPSWFLEGDAVLTETLLSDAGRGRNPLFFLPLRSKILSGELPTWDQVNLGSYRDVYPNHYLFGYFMTARGRMLSYPFLWSDNLEFLGRNPFQIPGFSQNLKNKTGLTANQLYYETVAWLEDFWKTNPPDTAGCGLLNIMHCNTSDYRAYVKPFYQADGSLIVLKRSLGRIPAFVRIHTDGEEEILKEPGAIEDAGFSVGNGRIYWAEQIPDHRWEHRSWSDLFSYDLHSGKTTRLTNKTRYFSPVPDPSGKYLACSEEDKTGRCHLVILDARTGAVIKQQPLPEGEHVSYSCWGSSEWEIFAVSTSVNGKKVFQVDFINESTTTLMTAGYLDVGMPAFFDGKVYFTAPDQTTLALFSLDPATGVLKRVLSHPNGVNYTTVNDGKIGLSVHTSKGYRPAWIDPVVLPDALPIRMLSVVEPVTRLINRAPGEDPISAKGLDSVSKIQPYKKRDHLIRLHSWAPVFIDPEQYQISPGMVLMSQNTLGTLTATAGYQYSMALGTHNAIAGVRYTGLLPVLEADFRREYGETGDSLSEDRFFPVFQKQMVQFKSSLPLNFSSGVWSRRINPGIYLIGVSGLPDSLSDANGWTTGANISFSFLKKISYRDLWPRWGFAGLASAGIRPFGPHQSPNLYFRGTAYLPGLVKNGSFRLLLSFAQFNRPAHAGFEFFDIPRGTVRKHSTGGTAFRADWAFPVAYPDWSAGWLVYIRRIKADFFFDAYHYLQGDWIYSSGMDLRADFNLFRAGFNLDSGVRIFFLPGTGKLGFEFLYGFSL